MAAEDQANAPTSTSPVHVEVKGKNPALARAAAAFGAALATTVVTLATISPVTNPLHTGLSMADLMANMQATGAQNQAITATAAPSFMDGAPAARMPGVITADVKDVRAMQANAPRPADGQQGHIVLAALDQFDKDRLEVLSHPVPSETKAAAEMARAMPIPKTLGLQPPSPEQLQILKYGQFAPVASRVHNNVTGQMETHWALHPWDVVRLAEQASGEVFKEKGLRVDPKLIGAAYYAESAGVVQQGWDEKGVALLEKGKTVEHVAKSGSKASYGLFQLDERMGASAQDIDPVTSAKRAAALLAEGQENARVHPELGMVAFSATYNASSNLRAKIFAGAPLTDKEQTSYESVLRHAANMSYGANLYQKASTTYHQHLVQTAKMNMPVAVAADSVRRADPLQAERTVAVNALTGRVGRNPTPGYAPDNIVLPDPQPSVQLTDGSTFSVAPAAAARPSTNALTGRPQAGAAAAPAKAHPTAQQLERAVLMGATADRDAAGTVLTRFAETLRAEATVARLTSEVADKAVMAQITTRYETLRAAPPAKNALTGLLQGNDAQPEFSRASILTTADLFRPLDALEQTAQTMADKADRSESVAHAAERVDAAGHALEASATNLQETFKMHAREFAADAGAMMDRVITVHQDRLVEAEGRAPTVARAAHATPVQFAGRPTPQQLERVVLAGLPASHINPPKTFAQSMRAVFDGERSPVSSLAESLRAEASVSRRAAEAAQQAVIGNAATQKNAMRSLTAATNALTSRSGNVVTFHNEKFDERSRVMGVATQAILQEPALEKLAESTTAKADRDELLAHGAELLDKGLRARPAYDHRFRETFKMHAREFRADASSMMERVLSVHRERQGEVERPAPSYSGS